MEMMDFIGFIVNNDDSYTGQAEQDDDDEDEDGE